MTVPFVGDSFADTERIPGLGVWNRSIIRLIEKYKNNTNLFLSPGSPFNGIRKIAEIQTLAQLTPPKTFTEFKGKEGYPRMMVITDPISTSDMNWLITNYFLQLDWLTKTYPFLTLVPLAAKFQLSIMHFETPPSDIYSQILTKYKSINLDTIPNEPDSFIDNCGRLSLSTQPILNGLLGRS